MRTFLEVAATAFAWGVCMGLTFLAAEHWVTPILLALAGIPS